MRPILEDLKISVPLGKILDVGCGTGRFSQICSEYQGVDISPSMVSYCKREGIPAKLIDGPKDIEGDYEWVAALSVFTHIYREDRRDYLAAFSLVAPNLLVDIIPGEEGGSIGLTRAVVEDFDHDLDDFGYRVLGVNETISPDGASHRLYRCRLSPQS